MALKLKDKEVKRPRNYRLSEKTIGQIDMLAEAYGVRQGDIIEAIFETYTPALLRDAKK